MEVSGYLHILAAFHLAQEPRVPTEQEVGWAPEPAWMPRRRDKSLVPALNQATIVSCPSCSLLILLTELLQLRKFIMEIQRGN